MKKTITNNKDDTAKKNKSEIKKTVRNNIQGSKNPLTIQGPYSPEILKFRVFLSSTFAAEPHSSVGSVADLRTGGSIPGLADNLSED